MSFVESHIILLDEFEGVADARISSSPLGLIRLSLLPASKVRSLFNDKVHISGDVEFGQDVKKLFDELDIDWEGHLARFTGDVIAYQVGSFVRQGISFQKKVRASFSQSLTEYIQEELRVSPGKEEIEDFFKDIDELTLDVERLEAHILEYKAHHEVH